MKKKNPNTIKWFTLASVFFILVSFFIYWNNANAAKLESFEEKDTMQLFIQTKSALDTLSVELNKAQIGVNTLDEYTEVKEKVFKN